MNFLMVIMASGIARGRVRTTTTTTGRLYRVATVREKSGKIKNFSRSGKSQGILQKVRENLSSCQSQ